MAMFGDENLFSHNPLLGSREVQQMMQLHGANTNNSFLDFDEHFLRGAGGPSGSLGISQRTNNLGKMEQMDVTSSSGGAIQNQKSKTSLSHHQNIPSNNGTNASKNNTGKQSNSQNKHHGQE